MISTVLDERRLPSLRGQLAIAHCRYSTTGSTIWENAQPTYRLGPRRALAIGHNGNLVNTRDLLDPARSGGRARLPASTDTELLTALLADEPAADTVEALRQVLPRVRGAYSLVVLDERRVIGVRDPFGFRPLVLGRLPAAAPVPAPTTACGAATTPSAGWCLSSETAAPRHRRRRVRPRRRARARSSSSSPGRRRAPSASPRRPRRCASSSSSTSPGPIRTWRAATCTRPGAGWGCSSPSSTRSTPTWSCPSPTPAHRPRPASPRRPGCRTARGCTATATPGGRSSSRRPGCATGA